MTSGEFNNAVQCLQFLAKLLKVESANATSELIASLNERNVAEKENASFAVLSGLNDDIHRALLIIKIAGAATEQINAVSKSISTIEEIRAPF